MGNCELGFVGFMGLYLKPGAFEMLGIYWIKRDNKGLEQNFKYYT